MQSVALIVASGRGERFGGSQPKQYRSLAGRPVLRHTLERFARHPRIGAVRAVIRADDRDPYDAAAAGLDVLPPVLGGASRQESVRLGLESLAADPPDVILIHDGVRPLVSNALIDRVLDRLADRPAVLPAIAVADTLKRAADRQVVGTIERAGLYRAQTPQGFDFEKILAAHRQFDGAALTDDCAVAEAAGLPVSLADGDDDNFKITAPGDLTRAEFLLGGVLRPRTGVGFDVHRLEPGDGMVLLGVPVESDCKLIGHSDADVGLHALTDAILGALAAGDIGSHFPPGEPHWAGADSALFLAHARELVEAAHGRIDHVDVTLICERPKIGPHRAAMVDRIASLLGLPPVAVSVKATTTERLGFTGRGEGIAAQAVATVSLPPIGESGDG